MTRPEVVRLGARRAVPQPKGVHRMKRLVTTVMVVLAAMLVDAAAAPGQVTTERTRVKFTMTSKDCSRLPAGTRLKGSGRERAVTKTTTDANGLKTVVNYTRTLGKATDQDHKAYKFDYRNSFAVTNSAATPATFTGTMFDLFELTSRGRKVLANGFVATWTTDFDKAN